MIQTMTPRGGKREGAGRKPLAGEDGPRLEIVKVALWPDDVKDIKRIEAKTGKPRSEILREVILMWLKRQPKD